MVMCRNKGRIQWINKNIHQGPTHFIIYEYIPKKIQQEN